MTRRKRDTAPKIFLAIAGTAGLLALIALAIQVTKLVGGAGDRVRAAEANDAATERWLWLKSPEDGLAWLTLLLVVGTAGLAFFTAKLWLDARHSARIQRRQDRKLHRRELRAYVAIESARITYNSATKAWESRIAWRNCGKTPALEARIYGVLWLTTWPIQEGNLKTITDDDPDASRFVLGPGVGRTKIDEPENAGFLEVEPEALREGNWTNPAAKVLVALGRIFYKDIYGRAHETSYRYYVGGKEGLRDPISPADDTRIVLSAGMRSYRMVAHSRGNGAD
jgi:hypothetical protein